MKFPLTTRRQWFVLTVLAALNLFFVGCATLDGGGTAGAKEAAQDIPTSEPTDRFQKGDLVKVEFSGTPETIPAHEEHIKDDGTITLPYVGAIKAANKTPGELQRAIHAAYVPTYYKSINVTVKGADRFYIVGGEVKSPGRQVYLGPITLTGAIKSSGDFTDFANKKKVELTRANGRIYIINAEKLRKNADLDPRIYPGDSINVPRTIW